MGSESLCVSINLFNCIKFVRAESKRNSFWTIYSRDHWTHSSWILLSLQRAGTNSFHLLRQYWSTSSNDLNSVTRNRYNKSFYLICLKERIPYYTKHRCLICTNIYMFSIIKSDIVITRSNVTWFSIQHCSDWSMKQNTNQTINSQLRYPISRPYGWIMGRLLWGFARKLSALGAYFLAPNAAYNTIMVLHENESYHTEQISRYKNCMLILLHEILDIYFGFLVIKSNFYISQSFEMLLLWQICGMIWRWFWFSPCGKKWYWL